MPGYILEGDSFFVLDKLRSITQNKKVSYQPEMITKSISFLNRPDFYVFFSIDKDLAEIIINQSFVVCNLNKNFDLRLDWVKKLKNKSEYYCFDPIPSTDFLSLQKKFPTIKNSRFLPVKNTPLKYKNTKQNYEWFDLDLINDLLPFQKDNIFEEMCENYFDIWMFTDCLWDCNLEGLNYIKNINNDNFENYFNRIRETIKDYIEVHQSDSKSFNDHRLKITSAAINNEFRFLKVKEKLAKLDTSKIAQTFSLYDECLKNVREGANPKLELIKTFFRFKDNVRQ
jgi:hypothetical protein